MFSSLFVLANLSSPQTNQSKHWPEQINQPHFSEYHPHLKKGNNLLYQGLLNVQVPCAQVYGPGQSIPPHFPQSGAPTPPVLDVVVVVVVVVVLGVLETVVVVDGVREIVVVVIDEEVLELTVVVVVVVVEEDEVLELVELVLDEVILTETEEVVLPELEIVPKSLISLELAPTKILKSPVGKTHFWAATSQ